MLLPEGVSGSSVTVAAVVGQAPMMYIEEGEVGAQGVEADVIRAAGEVLGVEIVFEETKPESFMAMLLSERADLAAGSITYTPERAEQLDFVVYAQYGQALVALADAAETDFDNLCGLMVGILTGSIQQHRMVPELDEACVAQGEPKIEAVAYPDANALVLAIQSGRIDVGFINATNALYQADRSNGQLEVVATGYGNDPKGLAIRRDSELSAAFEAAITHLADEGVLTEIFNKWGLDDSVMVDSVALNPPLG